MSERKDGADVSRRRMLQCMSWAGAGILWTVTGGVPRGIALGGAAEAAEPGAFHFVQISDSHIGFKGEANPNPNATLQQALERVAALPQRPAMLVHTGDVTHLSKPEEFDTAAEILKSAKQQIHYVPGEHDVIGDDGKAFFARFVPESKTAGWYSFDQGGVHFVALINVLNFKPGAGGSLGTAQTEWLEKDLKGRPASTPIVVLAHMPLWPIYPQWGWSTDDADKAFSYLKRFGSVTVLNGHIHQVVQKVEGKVTFQTALSTAFPQPPAGEGKGPAPLKVAEDKLKSMLGIRQVEYQRPVKLSIQDQTLA